MAKRSLYADQEAEEEQFDPAALARAIHTFAMAQPPTPEGKKPNERYSTAKLLGQFQALYKGLCNERQLHDALIAEGYRYEHANVGFQWCIGIAPGN